MKIKQSILSRRQFLNSWILGTGTIAGSTIIHTIFSALLPQSKDEEPSEISLSTEYTQINPNTARPFFFGRTPSLLINSECGELIALQAICTHFECAVHYDPMLKKLVCPCHQGFFDIHGNNLSGPPPRPLLRYQIRRVDNGLVISLEHNA